MQNWHPKQKEPNAGNDGHDVPVGESIVVDEHDFTPLNHISSLAIG
jgi:hypothetical protein